MRDSGALTASLSERFHGLKDRVVREGTVQTLARKGHVPALVRGVVRSGRPFSRPQLVVGERLDQPRYRPDVDAVGGFERSLTPVHEDPSLQPG